MGKRIVAFFAEAEKLGGLEGKIRLAMLTRITSTRAQVEPDTTAIVAKFEQAMTTLRAELARSSTGPVSTDRRSQAGPSSAPPPTSPTGTHPMPPLRAPGEASLPGGEELLWGVLSSLHDAMVAVFDTRGVPVLAWESRSLGRRFGVGAGDQETAADAIARMLAQERAAQIQSVFSGAEPVEQETLFSFRGQSAWLGVSLSPVHDSSGRIAAVAAFVQDITERRRSEEALRESERRLREHNRIYLDLVADKSVFLGDLTATNRRICEAAARTLGVERVSVWLYDERRTKIVCQELYALGSGHHGDQTELWSADFPSYFAALETERTIAADNAHTDPRTAEFSASYLTPLGINSMLDVPIRVAGKMIGVVCHEHVGPARKWTADEENFAYLMANFVALSKEMAR
ncbi:MAG: GAF domain-containing protein [Byssovorax sp.]